MKLINQHYWFLLCIAGTLAFSAEMLVRADVTAATTSNAIITGTNLTAEVEAKAKPDLLKTCPVSGDTLGEMGAPYKLVYKGQLVKLCCPGCKKDFLKDPDKYMATIRAADPAPNK